MVDAYSLFLIFLDRYVGDSGMICILLSQAVYALLGIFMKLLVQGGMSVFEPLCLRSVLCTIMCLAVFKVTGRKDILGPRDIWKYNMLMSLAGNIGFLLFFEASVLLPAGDAMAISRLSPVFAVICARVLHWEKINVLIVLGGLMSSAGGVVIARPPLLFGVHEDWNTVRIIGLCLALTSAMFAAVCFTTVGRIGTRASSLTLGTWAFLGGIPLSGIPLMTQFPLPPLYSISIDQFFFLFAFVLLAFLGYLLLTRGVQLCNGVKGTSVQPAAVVFSYLWGYLMLHETISFFSFCGTVMIVLGVTMVSLGKSTTCD